MQNALASEDTRAFDWRSRRWPTLPRSLERSTIGAVGLNDRVRNGNGCGPYALTASNSKISFPATGCSRVMRPFACHCLKSGSPRENDQSRSKRLRAAMLDSGRVVDHDRRIVRIVVLCVQC